MNKLSASLLSLLLTAGCSSVDVSLDVPDENSDPEFTQQRASHSFSNQLNDYYVAAKTGSTEQGEVLFNEMCSSCHQSSSQSELKKLFKLRPDSVGQSSPQGEAPDFKGQKYQTNSAEEYLFLRIKYGKQNDLTVHSMPSWEGALSGDQINNLVAYIMSVAK